jgi:hypothetical protein
MKFANASHHHELVALTVLAPCGLQPGPALLCLSKYMGRLGLFAVTVFSPLSPAQVLRWWLNLLSNTEVRADGADKNPLHRRLKSLYALQHGRIVSPYEIPLANGYQSRQRFAE